MTDLPVGLFCRTRVARFRFRARRFAIQVVTNRGGSHAALVRVCRVFDFRARRRRSKSTAGANFRAASSPSRSHFSGPVTWPAISPPSAFLARSRSSPLNRGKTWPNAGGRKPASPTLVVSWNDRPVFPPMPRINLRARSAFCGWGSNLCSDAATWTRQSVMNFHHFCIKPIGSPV